jgi:lysozyme family protein
MTTDSYRRSLALVLAHEGGYVNNPHDPGGPTCQGITQNVYDTYRKLHGAPLTSVKTISVLEVEEIYRKQYWRSVRGDDMPTGLDYAIFDFAVNSGLARAIRYLQRQVGVNDDGVLANETIVATIAASRENPNEVIIQYCANRLAFMKSLSTYSTFGSGWFRRVMGKQYGAQSGDDGVIDIAVDMAASTHPLVMPTAIGVLPGEVPGKAYSPNADIFPTMTLDEITASNDKLAVLIMK